MRVCPTLVVALLPLIPACKAPPANPAGGAASDAAPRTHAASKTDAGAAKLAELQARPGYTFNEMELGLYVGALQAREPDVARRVIHLARKNLGQPYQIYLLGEYPYELYDADPIYCLRKSDCLTFCEHVYAAALSRDWWSYLAALQRLRYRDGVISMLTRNHFTEADWNRSNAFLFEDLTTTLGGGGVHVPLTATIRRARFFAQFGIGQDMPDEALRDAYTPKARVPEILSELRAGDMVNIVRGDARAQWVGHTGLIAIGDDGGVNFLHSAKPTVREEPLMQYLSSDKRCVGIRILRLRPGAQQIMDRTLAASPRATPTDLRGLLAALGRTAFAPGSPLVHPLLPRPTPPAVSLPWPRRSADGASSP